MLTWIHYKSSPILLFSFFFQLPNHLICKTKNAIVTCLALFPKILLRTSISKGGLRRQAHVRFVVARVRVRAKIILRAARFLAYNVQLHFCTLFGTKQPESAIFGCKKYSRMSYPFSEHPKKYFRTFYSVLERPFLF